MILLIHTKQIHFLHTLRNFTAFGPPPMPSHSIHHATYDSIYTYRFALKYHKVNIPVNFRVLINTDRSYNQFLLNDTKKATQSKNSYRASMTSNDVKVHCTHISIHTADNLTIIAGFSEDNVYSLKIFAL